MPEILHKTKYLELRKDGRWVYAHRPNVKDIVVIVPIIHNKDGESLIFLETERPPLKAEAKADRCIELPAGLVGDEDPNESVEDAARKELLEETGYEADNMSIESRNAASSGGCTSETFTIVVAHIFDPNVKMKPVDDGGVIKDRHIVPLKDVKSWIKEQEAQGKAIGAHALAGLFYVV